MSEARNDRNTAAQEFPTFTPSCWQCGGECVPHPRRQQEIEFKRPSGSNKKVHPYPENSFLCKTCEDAVEPGGLAVLLCDGCRETCCEWFYTLGEIWEDMDACGRCNGIYCQNCYEDNHAQHDTRGRGLCFFW